MYEFIFFRIVRGFQSSSMSRTCFSHLKPSTLLTATLFSLLYTNIPKWEELRKQEQDLYHGEKDAYIRSARKGGRSLSFAKLGTEGETWAPLVEKAYAKLHGNYGHLDGGFASEATEDLSG